MSTSTTHNRSAGKLKAAPIQLKVTKEVRKFFKKAADTYFDGNISATIRFAVYHCDFMQLLNSEPEATEDFTTVSTSPQVIAELKKFNDMTKAILDELHKIGVNINQATHKINLKCRNSPDALLDEDINTICYGIKQLNSIRSAVAELRYAFITKHK